MISEATTSASLAGRGAPLPAPVNLRATTRAFERAARRLGMLSDPLEFPEAGFALLQDFGLHAPAVRSFWGGLPDAAGRVEPADRADLADLLYLLRGVGRVSLPLGRLYEGHLNALQLIGLFGSPAQRALARRDLVDGLIFAVWNSDARRPLRLDATGEGSFRLSGGKAFASGAGRVERPIVTARLADGGGRWCCSTTGCMRRWSIRAPGSRSAWRPRAASRSICPALRSGATSCSASRTSTSASRGSAPGRCALPRCSSAAPRRCSS